MTTNDAADAPATERDWTPIRADYKACLLTLGAISRKHGATVQEILQRSKTHKWERDGRDPDLDRRIIIHKLIAVLEVQIDQIGKDDMTGVGDKEASVLGKLAGNLEKLIALDEKASPMKKSGKRQSKAMLDIKARLADRIARLKQG